MKVTKVNQIVNTFKPFTLQIEVDSEMDREVLKTIFSGEQMYCRTCYFVAQSTRRT
jgi:hypothetical protein